MAGQLWSIRDPDCGGVLVKQAGPIAAYWTARAAANPSLARTLEGLTTGGGWLGLVTVHAPLVLGIFAHHVAPVLERRQAAALAAQEAWEAEAAAAAAGFPFAPAPEPVGFPPAEPFPAEG